MRLRNTDVKTFGHYWYWKPGCQEPELIYVNFSGNNDTGPLIVVDRNFPYQRHWVKDLHGTFEGPLSPQTQPLAETNMTLSTEEELRLGHKRLDETRAATVQGTIEFRINWLIDLLVTEARADRDLRLARDKQIESLKAEIESLRYELGSSDAQKDALNKIHRELIQTMERRNAR